MEYLSSLKKKKNPQGCKLEWQLPVCAAAFLATEMCPVLQELTPFGLQ